MDPASNLPQPNPPLLTQFEAGIVALLQPLAAPGAIQVLTEVEALPETKGGLEDALIGARVTVCYRQSSFGDGSSSQHSNNPFYGGLGQISSTEETLNADVFVRARGRSNAAGVYAVIEAVRRLLLGATPMPGARGLVFTGQQLDDFETRGAWRYMLSVSSSTVIVADVQLTDEAVANAVAFAWELDPLNFNPIA